MQIEVELDDELLAEAKAITGLTDVSEVVRAGLVLLIQRGAALALARLGGSDPDAQYILRRRSAKALISRRGKALDA